LYACKLTLCSVPTQYALCDSTISECESGVEDCIEAGFADALDD